MKKSKCWQWANCNKICTKIVRSSREKKESSQIIGALPKATRNETGRWTKNNVPAYWKTIKARLGKSSLYTPRVQRFSSPSPANVARPFRRGNRDIGKRPTTKFSKLKRPVPRIASLPAKINASDAEHLRNTHTHTHTHTHMTFASSDRMNSKLPRAKYTQWKREKDREFPNTHRSSSSITSTMSIMTILTMYTLRCWKRSVCHEVGFFNT